MTEMLVTTIIVYSLIGLILAMLLFTLACFIFSKMFINELYKMLQNLKNDEE